jgi:transposase InsO family protein/transposase-like protein
MNKEIKNSKVMRYSYEQKVKIVEDYLQSKLTVQKYSKISGVSQGSLHRWLSQFNERSNYVHRRFSPEQRKETIEAFKKSGLTQKDFAKTWGIDSKTLGQWNKIYKSEGPKGLMDGVIYPTKETPEKRGRKGTPQMLKEKVIEVKKRLPDYGLKKLRDVLSRFEGISIAPNTIKKVLVENDLYVAPEVPPKKDVKQHITRFERATPMQLWQSDITSFVLKRTGQRVYLVVFKDDHSRYVVSWSLALQQTGNFVIECLLDGVQKYGLPQEVLTDQGRQYFSWRGKSEFQKVLAREGIEHVVARSHHPQTLGKCERLWKTIGIEFWERAKPQNLDEVRGTISLSNKATLKLLEKENLPLVYMSDNGSAYVSEEVSRYLAKRRVIHLKSLPRTPQHNGAAEVLVREVKRLYRDCENERMSDQERLDLSKEILNKRRLWASLNYRTVESFVNECKKINVEEIREELYEQYRLGVLSINEKVTSRKKRRVLERELVFNLLEKYNLIRWRKGGVSCG